MCTPNAHVHGPCQRVGFMPPKPALPAQVPAPASAKPRSRVVVMLPAFNEEQDLPLLLHRIERSLKPWADYRVLVVDDGSKDGTAAIVRQAALHMPVQLIQHRLNRGLGIAIRTGLVAACQQGEVVVTLDADNSQDPALIRRMVRHVEARYDVVIASRFRPGAQQVGVPRLRRWLSRVASTGLRWLAPYKGVRDYTCGFRAYRADTLRVLMAHYGSNFVRENGFACMLEILLNLRRLNARVGEVALVLRYDMKAGDSKMRVLRTTWRYAVTLFRACLPLDRPLRAHGPTPASVFGQRRT